jgi:phage gp16-like protein
VSKGEVTRQKWLKKNNEQKREENSPVYQDQSNQPTEKPAKQNSNNLKDFQTRKLLKKQGIVENKSTQNRKHIVFLTRRRLTGR